jgi:hypothetical protein
MSKLFWDWFSIVERDIYENIESTPDVFALDIKNHLNEVNGNLEFEISFDMTDNKRNFVISADGIYELFDLVLELVNGAPEYERWNIVAFRPRLKQRNQVIELEGVTLDYDDIFFTYQEVEYSNKISIDVYINGFDGSDNRFIHIYFILLDSLIGEYDAVTMIEETTIMPYDDQENVLGIKEIIGIVDALKKKNVN